MARTAKTGQWFGMTRATFQVIPRVLWEQMSAEWQDKMVDLLEEMNEEFPNLDFECTIRELDDAGKLKPVQPWLLNYRYPDYAEINKCRKLGET